MKYREHIKSFAKTILYFILLAMVPLSKFFIHDIILRFIFNIVILVTAISIPFISVIFHRKKAIMKMSMLLIAIFVIIASLFVVILDINSPTRNFPSYSSKECYSTDGKDATIICVYHFDSDIQNQLLEEYEYTYVELSTVSALYPYLDKVENRLQYNDLLDLYMDIEGNMAQLSDYYYIYTDTHPDGGSDFDFDLYYYDVDENSLYYIQFST